MWAPFRHPSPGGRPVGDLSRWFRPDSQTRFPPVPHRTQECSDTAVTQVGAGFPTATENGGKHQCFSQRHPNQTFLDPNSKQTSQTPAATQSCGDKQGPSGASRVGSRGRGGDQSPFSSAAQTARAWEGASQHSPAALEETVPRGAGCRAHRAGRGTTGGAGHTETAAAPGPRSDATLA